MRKSSYILKKILSWCILIFAIYALYQTFQVYKQRDYINFVRAERNVYTSTFTRDPDVTADSYASYKIESPVYNDAMFYTKVNVKPNTPYKVTCKVKTKGIEAENGSHGGGAQIAIEGTTERSKIVSGTQKDWQEITFYFDSKTREEVNISFRLGGYDCLCKGTAWFSDLKMEEGTPDTGSVWNMACFIFYQTDVTINQKRYQFQIDEEEAKLMKSDMERFKNTCAQYSQGKMSVRYQIIPIETPITSISYDEENAYYVNPTDVENLIQPYIEKNQYDHIFAVVKLGDLTKHSEIPVNDWIGLGGMEYQNIGFSNIRLPNDKNSYMYRYDTGVNQFPEEVFLHEFLHTLEKNATDNGYQVPALHDHAKYGYQSELYISLANWYRDYMQKRISDNGTYIGLDPKVYTIKPVKESDFLYGKTVTLAKEPNNMLEEIQNLTHNVVQVLTSLFHADEEKI